MQKDALRLRRLGWAGVEIEYNNETLVIDYIQDTSTLVPLRSPNEPFPSSSRPGEAITALLTHVHADHADPGALSKALLSGAPVFRPEPAQGTAPDLELTSHAEAEFEKYLLNTRICSLWEEYVVGPFRLIPVPAVDGFGDPQVSWIVECGGRRMIHAGDTIFHGYWWKIAHRFGNFDAAFLPINGAVVTFPFLQPASPLEAIMTPEQAAIAASILQASRVIPIHYQSLHKPPMYTEVPHATEHLQKHLAPFGIRPMIQVPGDWFTLE